MKTASPPLLSRFLPMAVLVAVCTLATGPARAENPFKFLGNKAKQGLTKVVRTIDPRRVGTVVRKVKHAVVAPVPPSRVRPVSPYSDPSAAIPRLYEEDGTPIPQRVDGGGMRRPPYAPSGDSPRFHDPEIPDPIPDRTQTGRPNAGARPNELYRSPLSVHPTPVPLREVPPAENTARLPAAMDLPLESPRPSSIVKRESTSRATLPPPSPPATAAKTPSAPARQDLPFGELVPGKTGFVHSPYAKTDLVDVTGIPTGTKVKCPYTGKTFRVP